MDEEKEKNSAGNILLAWEAPEYTYYEKSADWYWWVGLFSLILVGLAIWQKSFLFGVLIFLMWFAIMIFAIQRPRIFKFIITDHGIIVKDRLYLWKNLDSFWIFDLPPLRKELSLLSKKTLVSRLKIPLGDLHAEDVRNIVSSFIHEIEQRESFIDNLSQLVRF